MLSGEEGVFIVDVTPSGVADKAGAKICDRVLEVNGENVKEATHEQIVEKVRRKTDYSLSRQSYMSNTLARPLV